VSLSPIEADRLIPTREVANRFGYTVAGLLDAVKRRRFPTPIRMSKTRYVWLESVLAEHMARLRGTSPEGGPSDAQ
jgi:predicted DNA-binding transcriptional regulator AlpA